MNWKNALSRHETLLGLTIVALALVIGLINPAFFSVGNMCNLVKSTLVLGILALGLLIVVISGGIDVSFTAIATVALYVTAKILVPMKFNGSILVPFAIGAAIGILLGLINATFISLFKLQTLIVTLGTMSMFRGFMLAFIGSQEISNLPPAMIAFSRLNLWAVKQGRALYGLHSGILILIPLALLTWFILNRTMIGRGIYAYGGDPAAAERVGFNPRRIQFFIYAFSGFLAGIAGILHSSLSRTARPFDLVGVEMTVIAAVVLGGARLTGGHGSVAGTLLGVLLVAMVSNSLILMGIPSYWQQVVLGALILIGTGVPIYRARRRTAS